MSIRARLLIATAVVIVIALVGADIATYASLRSYLYGQIDSGLELSHRPVEASVSQPTSAPPNQQAQSKPPTPADVGPEPCSTFDGHEVETGGLNPGTFIEVRNTENRKVYQCTIQQLGTHTESPPILPAKITGFVRDAADNGESTVYFTAAAKTGGAGYRVRASVLRGGPDVGGDLVVAVPLASAAATLSDLFGLEAVATAGAILVALVLGWWLVTATLHPLRDIERTADAIAAGQLSERVSGDEARTEIGHVAHAFNVMLGRIEDAFAARDRQEGALRVSEERMRHFVADASHELRTPLAAVRAYADLFDRGAADRPDDLERVMHGIQHESARMSRLVEDFLLLARLDEGRPLDLEPIDLVALAADAVATAEAVGPQWPVRLRAAEPVEVLGDELRLRQVVDNLLANVRVHTPPGTVATVRVAQEGADVLLSVGDGGPGLTEEQQRRIFERFFRADPSRSRDRGGSGLGLAIADAIVRAHGGSVTVSSSSTGGAQFTVHLPGRLPDIEGSQTDPGSF